jgi:threonine dehydrogenase-like Zn-dependent dehydrogenase
VLVAARYPHQAEHARALGADEILPAGAAALRAAVVARTGARRHEPEIGASVVLGGVDVTFDCIGSSATIDEAVRLTRARGTVVVAGMPGTLRGLEGTALWYKETRLVGAYAYGLEQTPAGPRRTFDLAIEAAAAAPGTLAALVTGRYRLAEYRRAIAAALHTGRERGVKTVFDLR